MYGKLGAVGERLNQEQSSRRINQNENENQLREKGEREYNGMQIHRNIGMCVEGGRIR